MVNDPVVIADLTDYNPNVLWELGIRQSFKHGTITIAKKGTKLPFDISTKRTIFYDYHDHVVNEQFKKDLLKALADCLENPERPDSHILEIISGRGTLYQIIKREENIRKLDALAFECVTNSVWFEELEETTKKFSNLTNKFPYKFPLGPYRKIALEYLVVTRYIDEEKKIYSLADILLMRYLNFQKFAGDWIKFPEVNTEKLLEVTSTTLNAISALLKEVNKIKNDLI